MAQLSNPACGTATCNANFQFPHLPAAKTTTYRQDQQLFNVCPLSFGLIYLNSYHKITGYAGSLIRAINRLLRLSVRCEPPATDTPRIPDAVSRTNEIPQIRTGAESGSEQGDPRSGSQVWRGGKKGKMKNFFFEF